MDKLPQDMIFEICRYLKYDEARAFKNISLPITKMILNSEILLFDNFCCDRNHTVCRICEYDSEFYVTGTQHGMEKILRIKKVHERHFYTYHDTNICSHCIVQCCRMSYHTQFVRNKSSIEEALKWINPA